MVSAVKPALLNSYEHENKQQGKLARVGIVQGEHW